MANVLVVSVLIAVICTVGALEGPASSKTPLYDGYEQMCNVSRQMDPKQPVVGWKIDAFFKKEESSPDADCKIKYQINETNEWNEAVICQDISSFLNSCGISKSESSTTVSPSSTTVLPSSTSVLPSSTAVETTEVYSTTTSTSGSSSSEIAGTSTTESDQLGSSSTTPEESTTALTTNAAETPEIAPAEQTGSGMVAVWITLGVGLMALALVIVAFLARRHLQQPAFANSSKTNGATEKTGVETVP